MTSFRHLAMSFANASAAADEELAIDLLGAATLGGSEPGSGPITGTRALMLAVLEDAIRCYLDGRKHVAEESENWIKSNWRESPFSFVIVCETLHLDPQATRRMLIQMKASKVPSRVSIPRARRNVRVPGRVCGRKLSSRRSRRLTK